MNMLQRNPRDSKYREFHDGEYEYWPAKASRPSESTSFPAACLIAALAAATLLAAALTMLYSQTSPKAIYEDFAIVNVNIYNNVDNLDIRYTLSPKSDPDTVLQEGALEHSEHTLNLQGLTPGTQYILQYMSLKDGVWTPIGDFQFTTPGDLPEQTEPPLTTPTEPASGSEPTSGSKPTDQTEATTEATEATTEPEETTEPTKPPAFWHPQKPKPTPNPTPKPPANPEEPPTDTEESTPETEETPTDTEESTPETEETTPETEETTPETEETPTDTKPTALEPEIVVEYYYTGIADQSGIKYVYYSVQQTHSFQNIPDGAYTVTVFQDDENITNDVECTYTNGTLTVTDTKLLAIGEASTTTVTVVLNDGTSLVSPLEIVTPSMVKDGATLTATDNLDGTYTFTITVEADPTSKYGLAFDTRLRLPPTYAAIEVEMDGPVNGVYTGTYTAAIDPADAENAYVYVAAIWDKVGAPEDVDLAQSETAYAKLNP